MNKILAINDDNGETLTSHKEIAATAVAYVQSLLGVENHVEGFPHDLLLPRLTTQQSDLLTIPISAIEILSSLKGMAKNKCPGPDGFTTEFYLATWTIIEADVIRGLSSFFQDCCLPNVVSATAIALVPKHDTPSVMSDFRPISCCNVLYKCITKILAGRLKPIMSKIISTSQTAFIPGRQMGDNILLAQSLCRNYHLNSGQPRCMIKLDIKKAFDSLNWKFLFNSLLAMNFPRMFVDWVQKCVTSCKYSIKINGALEGFFPAASGVRQGDPLSPYLFVIAMEVFTACLNSAKATHDFRFHWKCQQLDISHLTFADDVLLFCHGDISSISALMEGINLFSSISGLSPNYLKSSIYFCNTDVPTQDSAIALTGFQIGTLPISYLGVPLITGRLTSQQCTPLVMKLCNRIFSWTNRFLSFAGRLQLINSVLFGIQSHWATHIFLPKSVLKRIQSLLTKFLWGGTSDSNSMIKVAWTDCCRPRNEGGLGIRDIFLWNLASILHQLWRLIRSPHSHSLWIAWFHTCFLRNKALWTAKCNSANSWCIRKILNSRPLALRYINYSIGQNSSFLLWHDPWLGRPLIEQFPHSIISIMESSSLAYVGTIMNGAGWTDSTSNHVLAIELRHLISSTSIGSRDCITWAGQKDVKLRFIWESIRPAGCTPSWYSIVWHPWAIMKCAFVVWTAFKGRLLTRDRMLRFGMHTDPLCVLCNLHPESISHLFSTCNYTQSVMNHCPYDLVGVWQSYLAGEIVCQPLPASKKQLASLYFSVAVYSIWTERNCRLHTAVTRSPQAVTFDIKRTIRDKLFSCPSFKKAAALDCNLISSLY